MKKLLVAILLLVVIAGAGAWYFVTFHLDNLIRQEIVQVAERSLKTKVHVGSVRTDLRAGTLTIEDITVANPPGFRNPNAFTLRGIEAAVDYETREILRIVVESPEITIEERDDQVNVAALLSAAEADSTPEPESDGTPPPQLVIHHFRMNSSRAAFESASLEHYSDVGIDAVELRDVRGTPQEVGRQLLRGALDEVVTAAAVELLKARASEKIDEAAKKLEEFFKRD